MKIIENLKLLMALAKEKECQLMEKNLIIQRQSSFHP